MSITSCALDAQYQGALIHLMENGLDSDDRTGVGTVKTFDENFHFDLRTDRGYILPALSLRKIAPRIAFEELMWMLRGSVDVTELQEKNIHIWDGNSTREFLDSRGLHHWPENTIGKGYGYQMRNFNGVDQLKDCFEGLRKDPNGRRHLISFWNPGDLKETALPPCHLLYNFMVTGEHLNLKFFQRSCDTILGAPMNLMFAGFWLAIFAKALDLKVGRLAYSVTDFHMYKNHGEAATEMCLRKPRPMPLFHIHKGLNSLDDILSLTWEDIDIEDYDPHPALDKDKLKMAV